MTENFSRPLSLRAAIARRFLALLAASLALPANALLAAADDDEAKLSGAANAYRNGEYSRVIDLTGEILAADPANKDAIALRANAFQERGEQNFRKGNVAESIADFDDVLKTFPGREPYNWQRGISLYYADRYEDGQHQFESHQTVNPQDVENAVWHFLCVARVKELGLEEARKRFIKITGDRRVPMKEVHALFAGTGSEESVLEAAREAGEGRDNALFYAHLYLGLYYEAIGEDDASLVHIRKAAGEYSQSHYMGDVAKVHLKLRAAAGKSAP